MTYILTLFLSFFIASCALNYNFSLQKNRPAAEANVKLGLAFLKQGYVKEAKKRLLLAKKLDENNALVWSAMGYFYETIEEIAQAKKQHEYAIFLESHSGVVHNNFGIYLFHRGQYKLALQHFVLAIEDPDYLDTALAYKNAGICALNLFDEKLARQYFKKAIAQGASMNQHGSKY